MPTSAGPNTFGEENLVFGYDLGDVSNSYKGEPTTNLITSGLPGYFGSGGETLYQERLYGLKSDSGVFQRNYITNPSTGNNGGLYKAFTTSALSSTTRYVQISFDFYLVTRYRTASSSTTGLNGYLRIQNTDGLYDNYGWDTRYSNGSSDDWNNDIQYEGKWQKVSLIAALRSDKTPSSINAMYIYYDFFTQGEGIFTNFIITETPTLPTGPVRYTAGTRSATQGLIDITGNSTIDLTNVSFDSNAQMTFDGTDEYINMGDLAIIKLGTNFTIECVVKPEQDKWMYFFHKGYGQNNSLASGRHSSSDNWFFSTMINGSYQNTYMGTATLNQYCHLVASYDGNNLRLYENGDLKATVVTTHDMMTSTQPLGIGGPDRYWNGEIPVTKVYSRALTASEIRANYNAVKVDLTFKSYGSKTRIRKDSRNGCISICIRYR